MIVEKLRRYKDNTARIKLLQLEIDGIKMILDKNLDIHAETEEEAITGMSLGASTVDEFKPDCLGTSNTTARVAANYKDEMMIKIESQILQSNIKDLESKMQPYIKDIKIVDVLMESLDKESKFILQKYYIEKLTIAKIQKELPIEVHETTIKRNKALALAKITQIYNEIAT